MSLETPPTSPPPLDQLASESARPGFEQAVFRRIASRRRGRLVRSVCAIAAIAALGWWIPQRATERAEREARIAETLRLEAEAAAVEREIERLRALSGSSRLYLGGSDRYDLVVDLDRLSQATASRNGRGDIRPAGWTP